jgi:protein tyrosine/serine phosphatase
MSARRSNMKRRCAARRRARLRNDALRNLFVEVAQAVAPQARRLNSDFREVPPPPHKGGAPNGNRNALKHGTHTRDRRALFAALNAHIAEGRALLGAFKSTLSSPGRAQRGEGDP